MRTKARPEKEEAEVERIQLAHSLRLVFEKSNLNSKEQKLQDECVSLLPALI